MPDAESTAHGDHPTLRLIVNADDFGRTETINEAVAQAHAHGILTSASLMVTGAAARGAVAVAQNHATLAVGLHLVLSRGRAALPPADIPHIVSGEGCFSRRPLCAGVRYFFSRGARRELRQEMRAQFEAFRQTGLSLSHVDGHHHMHLHPTVFRLLLPLAQEYGAGAVRVSISDKLFFSLSVDRSHPLIKVGWKIALSLITRWCRHALRRSPVPTAHRVYGLMQTGNVTEGYLLELLDRLVHDARRYTESGPEGHVRPRPLRATATETAEATPVMEIFCHPSSHRESSWLGPNPGDLAALLSPAVRAAIDRNGILLTTYPAIYRVPQSSLGAADPLGSAAEDSTSL